MKSVLHFCKTLTKLISNIQNKLHMESYDERMKALVENKEYFTYGLIKRRLDAKKIKASLSAIHKVLITRLYENEEILKAAEEVVGIMKLILNPHFDLEMLYKLFEEQATNSHTMGTTALPEEAAA